MPARISTSASAADVSIRAAGPADAAAVAALHTASWRDAYAPFLSRQFLEQALPADRDALWRERLVEARDPQCWVAVAQHAARMLGFVCVHPGDEPRWGLQLDNLHVLPAQRSKGIGRRLMCAAARRVLAQGTSSALHLLVIEGNLGARRFYERLGGEVIRPRLWDAPDGGRVPCLLYGWRDVRVLLAADGDEDAPPLNDPRA